MQCNREGCQHEAVWQIGFKAWAKGYDKATSTPLEGLIGIAVCDKHKAVAVASDFFGPSQTPLLDLMVLRAGKAPADWAGAELSFKKLVGGKLYAPGTRL